MSIQVIGIEDMPKIEPNTNLSNLICTYIERNKIELNHHDVLCVASKIVSLSENQIIKLDNVDVSKRARELHKKVSRKDPRVIQLILNETQTKEDERLDLNEHYIGGWLPNGLKLTSAGIDKLDDQHVVLLPRNADDSAKKISQAIADVFKKQVAVIITDSDGREDKLGATQVAIGVYGIAPLRINRIIENGKEKVTEETICDMLAATAGLVMGQRGVGVPVVLIKGYEYEVDTSSTIKDAVSRKGMIK